MESNELINISKLGEMRNIKIKDLLLDAHNPRFSDSQQGQKQERIAELMEMGFEAFAVAESICRYGFFLSEPLIAIRSGESDQEYIVVEGNRRLTALLGLVRPEFRKSFATPDRWDKLASQCELTIDSQIPVVIAKDRESCAPIIGFRHISGILSWSPFAQAKYVASLVDGRGLNFAEVAEMVGKKRGDVADLYRDQAIAEQAKEMGIDTGGIEQTFSLLTVAMRTTKIREHVGAPSGGHTNPGTKPIPSNKKNELKETLSWIFGDENSPPVVSDSRQISKLGNVIAESDGLAAIRKGKNLDEASQIIKSKNADPKATIMLRCVAARNVLQELDKIMENFVDNKEVADYVDEISGLIDGIKLTMGM